MDIRISGLLPQFSTILPYPDSSGLLSYPTQIVKGSIWLYLAAHPVGALSRPRHCWPRSVARLLGVGRGEEGVLKALVLLALLLVVIELARVGEHALDARRRRRGMADIRLSGYLELSALWGRLLGTFTGHFAARPPSRKSSAPGGAICPPARRRRRKFWRAKRWGHFCMEKVECPRTSAVPPPAVLPHVTYRCPTQVHMWPPIERRAYVPSRPSTQVPFTVLLGSVKTMIAN